MFILSRCLSGCVGESFKDTEMTRRRFRWGLGKGLASEGGGHGTGPLGQWGVHSLLSLLRAQPQHSTAAQAALHVVLIRVVCFMMALLSRVIYTTVLLILSLVVFKAVSFWIMKLSVFVPRDVPLVCRDTDVGKAH